jgi:hypothetical protein
MIIVHGKHPRQSVIGFSSVSGTQLEGYLAAGPSDAGPEFFKFASACALASACRSDLSALKIDFMANQKINPTTMDGARTAMYSMISDLQASAMGKGWFRGYRLQ